VASSQLSMIRLMPDRVARQINGPDDSARSSIPRHWRMNTSSCCQVLGVFAGQRNHLGLVFPHSRDLRAVVLDPAVPGDYEPALPRNVGNPYAVRGCRV
jgi:hypothetical protein